MRPDMVVTAPTRTRRRKVPHIFHCCRTVDELVDALRARGIDLVALVHEFVKPSAAAGILVGGSIAWGVATEFSDLDVVVLLPGPDALKPRRTRDIAGVSVAYLPSDAKDKVALTVFINGIEIDVLFVIKPDVARAADAGGTLPAVLSENERIADNSFLTRLATGWIVHGGTVVEQWRAFYRTGELPVTWMTREFTRAVKDLEDMDAGVGLAPGHVAALGVYAVTRLLRALMAYNRAYLTGPKWMLKIGLLIETADPETQDLLRHGRALAFPTLLDDPAEERAYIEQIRAYAARVRVVIGREEGVPDILSAAVRDLDIPL